MQCACRHLTEFTGKSAPSLPAASLSDMIGLNPADLVTKLRMLFLVVMILFGFSASCASLHDALHVLTPSLATSQ